MLWNCWISCFVVAKCYSRSYSMVHYFHHSNTQNSQLSAYVGLFASNASFINTAAELQSEQRGRERGGDDGDHHTASWKPVFCPCSGQQMGAVCSILALLLHDESSRIQPLNIQQMGYFPSSTQLSLSSQKKHIAGLTSADVFSNLTLEIKRGSKKHLLHSYN